MTTELAKGRSVMASEAEVFERANWKPIQLLVLGLCFLINMLDGMDLLVISYAAPVLSTEWKVDPASLGLLLSVAFPGMAIGGMVLAPLADRFGRRPLIVGALAFSSLAMLASGMAGTLSELLVLRLLVGIGIGVLLPTMSAMISEFAPRRFRDFGVGFILSGVPLGSTVTGFVAASSIPAFGWQATLWGAGLVSAAVTLPVALLLPESMQFLIRRQPPNALRRLNAVRTRLGEAALGAMPAPIDQVGRGPVAALFADGRSPRTLFLWVAISFGFMTLYFVLTWLPKLATMSGLAVRDAIYVGAIQNVGSFLGTTAVGVAATKFPLRRLVPSFLVISVLTLVVFGNISMPLPLLLFIGFLIGFFLQGGINSLYPLGAAAYPAESRSTGLGWATGIGRIGAISGPILAGMFVAAGVSLGTIFIIFCVPILIAALCAAFISSEEDAGTL